MPPPADLVEGLQAIDQSHVLRFWDELPEQGQQKLAEQVRGLDLAALPKLVEQYVLRKPGSVVPSDLEPAPYYPHDPESPSRPWKRDEYRRAGEELIRTGKVAAFTVAGGQGTRLGFDGPKGCFPGGAVTGKPLFAIFAEGVLAASRKYGAAIPWYIMTSPLNHEPTVEFFKKRDYFGLEPENVMFFPQGVIPSFEMGTGKLLLAAKDEIATNPDGHGGSIKALYVSGAIDDMRRRGVEQISYFQVDNPLVRVIDPVFLGLHAAAPDSSGEMSSKMVPKAYPEEKMGVFCRAEGRVRVIEYSDLPARLAHEKLADGSLRFVAGSIAVHIMSVEFVTRMNTEAAFALPYHRAEKKVPHVDLDTGALVDPDEPNGVKLERFVFDALPLCEQSLVMETERVEEFAPIKNATGVDSVETSRELQTMRAARWLQRVGVSMPMTDEGKPDCVCEISPLTALEPEDLEGKDVPKAIERSARIAL